MPTSYTTSWDLTEGRGGTSDELLLARLRGFERWRARRVRRRGWFVAEKLVRQRCEGGADYRGGDVDVIDFEDDRAVLFFCPSCVQRPA